jgi:cytidine deaminase
MAIPWERLRAAARDAAARAHAPYSQFRVGAAVWTASGAIVPGCNIENASYGLTMCAERVALGAALAAGERPLAIALVCPDAPPGGGEGSLSPCGACRQVMVELLPADAEAWIEGLGLRAVAAWLPNAFRL